MIRYPLTMLLAFTLLIHGPLTGRAQEASPIATAAALATPVSPSAEVATELLARIEFPAAAIPVPPAIVDVWLWSVRPNEALAFATNDAPPSIAADVVLAGEYSVRSDGRLQVQRDAGLEDVSPGANATVRPGDAVIYIENQAAQILRNVGTEEVNAISVGIYSTAPPWGYTDGPVSAEDWGRSGLDGRDLVVTVERLTMAPGAGLPAFVPDVHAPRLFAVIEGVVKRTRIVPPGTPQPPGAMIGQDQVIGFSTLGPGERLELRNDGDRPLVLLQVTIRADDAATPAAATPVA